MLVLHYTRWHHELSKKKKCNKLLIIFLTRVVIEKEGRENMDNETHRKYPIPIWAVNPFPLYHSCLWVFFHEFKQHCLLPASPPTSITPSGVDVMWNNAWKCFNAELYKFSIIGICFTHTNPGTNDIKFYPVVISNTSWIKNLFTAFDSHLTVKSKVHQMLQSPVSRSLGIFPS